jgi:hypothetical protein
MFDVGELDGANAGPAFEDTVNRLHDALGEVAGLWHAVAGQLVSLAATALSHELWSQTDIHTPEQWLALEAGISTGHARQVIALARRADELPVCMAALRAGEISLDHASAIARHVPACADGAVTELAKYATVSQLSRVVRAYAFDPDSGVDPDAKVPRGVRFGTVDENHWRMVVDTTADEAATIETALVAFRDRLFHAQQGCSQRCDISWLDAFNEMVEHALAHDGEVREHSDRARVLFHYEVDRAGQPVMHAHGQAPMPAALRRLWTCDATGLPVIHIEGRPVNVGRAQRVVPNRLRRILERRDGGCRVPGCNRARWVQIHHITHWEDGGATDSHNLVALCPNHHRLHHRGLLGIEGNADKLDGLTFTDQRGRQVTGRSRARPPNRPPDEAAGQLGIRANEWQPPTGEHIKSWWIDFGERPA